MLTYLTPAGVIHGDCSLLQEKCRRNAGEMQEKCRRNAGRYMQKSYIFKYLTRSGVIHRTT